MQMGGGLSEVQTWSRHQDLIKVEVLLSVLAGSMICSQRQLGVHSKSSCLHKYKAGSVGEKESLMIHDVASPETAK